MKYYKLIDPVDIPINLYLPHKLKNGAVKHEMMQLKPGKKYDEFIDDETFISALLGASKEIPYSAEREELLKEYGAKYEVRRCAPCQGRVKKLKVWFAEVVE